MKKRVYIVRSHHHVIKEWFRYRECGTHLLSFDYHTDFHKAFIGMSGDPDLGYSYSRERYNSYLNKHIPCADIESAIKDLKYDEHIDFSIRNGIIQKAFVFSCNDYVNDERVLTVPPIARSRELVQIEEMMEKFAPCIIKAPTQYDVEATTDEVADASIAHTIVSFPEHRHSLYRTCDESRWAKLVTTDNVLNEVLKTFREHGFNQDNYILDFDCDFIRDRGAMTQDKFNTFKTLIRGAKAITIALEPDCVRGCSEHSLTSTEIKTWLVALINECADADIQYEDETEYKESQNETIS